MITRKSNPESQKPWCKMPVKSQKYWVAYTISSRSVERILSCYIWDIQLNVAEYNDLDALYLCGPRIRLDILLIHNCTRDIRPRRNLSWIVSCWGIRSWHARRNGKYKKSGSWTITRNFIVKQSTKLKPYPLSTIIIDRSSQFAKLHIRVAHVIRQSNCISSCECFLSDQKKKERKRKRKIMLKDFPFYTLSVWVNIN